MATTRVVNTNFWRDTYVTSLTPDERLLFLYLLTNPATNLAGVYELDFRLVALDTGLSMADVQKIIGKFCRDKRTYYEQGWIVLRNFLKHQKLNPSMEKNVDKILDNLPQWLNQKLTKTTNSDAQVSLELPGYGQDVASSTQSVDSVSENEQKSADNSGNGTGYTQSGDSVLTSYREIKDKYKDKRNAPRTASRGASAPALSKKDSNAYAVEADAKLAQKEKASRTRALGEGYKKAASVAESIKQRKLANG